jgi:tetratricopeptide (TPR) repeat protein
LLFTTALLANHVAVPFTRAADDDPATTASAPETLSSAATNAAPPPAVLEQLQEQQKNILRAIEQVRRDAEAVARQNSDSITGRLSAIEQSLSNERQHELEALHKWNLLTLLAVGGFASLGFLGLLLVAPSLVRAMNRMSDAATTLRVPEHFRLGLPAPDSIEQALLPSPALAQSTARFLEALERIERRINHLESTVQAPQLPATNGVTHKSQPAQTDASPETTAAPERTATPGLRAEVVLEKGQALLSLGKADQALATFEEAIFLDADCAEAHVKKGRALEKLNRSEEALASYERAIALDPGMGTAYLCKGALLNNLARYTEAVQCYELALRVQEQKRGT